MFLRDVCVCVHECNVWGSYFYRTESTKSLLASDFKHNSHSINIHLVKIDICEAEIKRNLTLGIKVSFCGARPHTPEGR